MEGTTPTRPPGAAGPPHTAGRDGSRSLSRVLRRPAPDALPDSGRIAAGVFALVCLGFAIGFFVYPTYPNYDSYYSLLWGREVLDLQLPVFEGFRVPTEHPLAIAAGALLSLLGDGGDRVWVALTFVTYLWLVWGMYRLGSLAFTPLVGAAAAALLLTRLDYAFLAARGYIDVPYMALVLWAAVVEARRPRAGVPVFLLLAAAGMLRPEAWVLAGLYWLWMLPAGSWRQRALWAALAAVGPLVWTVVDFVVTGNPLFSLLYTSGSAEDLGRQRSLAELPSAVPAFFASIIKTPVLLAAVAGFGIAVLLAPRRIVMPLVLLVTGVGTFVLIGIAGASVIERYLTVAALGLLIFAAVPLAGFTLLEPGLVRRAWAAASVLAIVAGIVLTATQVRVDYFDTELSFRGAAHDDLVRVLDSAPVQDGLACGPLFVPSHKLVPDARWILGASADEVLPRADPDTPAPRRGVTLIVNSRIAIFKQAWSSPSDPATIQSPPAGWPRVVASDYYAAYARC